MASNMSRYPDHIGRLFQRIVQGTIPVPNILLHGPSGTGKTSTIRDCCLQLFGESVMQERVLFVSASEERGIQVIRETIKPFAQSKLGRRDEGYPCPDIKIVVVDAADALTVDAQSALRRVIETTASTTRFFFVCTYANKVIEPIVSRCYKCYFRKLSVDCLRDIMCADIVSESCPTAVLEHICQIVKGDIRKGSNVLRLCSLNAFHSEEDLMMLINELCGDTEDKLERLWLSIQTVSEEEVVKNARTLVNEGAHVSKILDPILERVMASNCSFDCAQKAVCLLAEESKALESGADELISLTRIAVGLHSIFHTSKSSC